MLCAKYVSIVNMSFISNKNDDYYTVSKDNTILNDKPIVNDKPGKTHNGFTKIMIIITLFVLLAGVIFLSIAIIAAYYNRIGSAVEMVAIMWLLLITLVIIIGM